jgi:hypothetical protein
MTGMNTHPIMTMDTAPTGHDDVIVTMLGMLEDRRETLQSKDRAIRERMPEQPTPRRRFQLETARTLQGSLLPLERRRALMTLAEEIGLRPFEATLMIAMAQDQVRNGFDPLADVSDIELARRGMPFATRPRRSPSMMYVSTAVCTGMVLASTLILWLSV